MKTWRDIRKNKDFGIKQTRVWITASPQRGREKPSQKNGSRVHQYHFSRFHVYAFNIQDLFFSSWWTYLQGTNRDAGIENGPGERECGVNWESSADTQALPCVTRPARCCCRAKGGSARGSDDLEEWGATKVQEGGDMCVLTADSLRCTAETNTT